MYWLVATACLLGLVLRDEGPVWSGHVGDHAARYFGRFGGDGARLPVCVGMAPVVGVAAGGDEEGEVEESGWWGSEALREEKEEEEEE